MRAHRNVPGLLRCLNLEPKEFGLCGFQPLQQVLTDEQLASIGLEIDLPHPQLHVGSSAALLTGPSVLWMLQNHGYQVEAVLPDIYTVGNPNTLASIPVGGRWYFADNERGAWLAVNGECVVFCTSYDELFATGTPKLKLARMRVGCAAYYDGRFLLGGFNDNQFFPADIADYIGDEANLDTYGLSRGMVDSFSSNALYWSLIDGADLKALFDLDDLVYGNHGGGIDDYGTLQDYFYDIWSRNEAGMATMPWDGTILEIHKIGDVAVIYGDGGVSAVKTTSEPVGTLSLLDVSRVGIASRGCVAAGQNMHVFMDAEGTFWSLDAQLRVQELGYREFGREMLGTEIMGSYNQQRGYYMFSNGMRNLIFNGRGMFETTQIVTSAAMWLGSCVGVCSNRDIMDRQFLIETAPFDLGNRDIKRLTEFEATGTFENGVVPQVSSRYRFGTAAPFKQSSWRRFGHDAFARLDSSGIEFTILLKGQDFDVTINTAKCEYQQVGKRHIRSSFQTDFADGAS